MGTAARMPCREEGCVNVALAYVEDEGLGEDEGESEAGEEGEGDAVASGAEYGLGGQVEGGSVGWVGKQGAVKELVERKRSCVWVWLRIRLRSVGVRGGGRRGGM